MARTTIKSSDLLADRPLEWNVYNADGTLLFARGMLIDAEAKGRLLRRGAVREVDAEIGKLLAAHGETISSTAAGEPAKGVRIPLSDTAVRPGDTVHLDRSLDGSRIMARLIGYLKGKSIVITVPTDEQGSVFLKEGESVVAKIFSGKHVLAFPGAVLAVALKPFPHIHLSYPAEVTGIVVRRSERAGVRLITAVETDREQTSGIITDLSTGGLSFASRSANIESGAQVVLNFKLVLADCTYLMKLGGLVRAVRANQSDALEGASAYGVQFREMSAEDTLILGLFVSQQLAAARSAGT